MKVFRRSSDNHRRVEFEQRSKPDYENDPGQKNEWSRMRKDGESYCFSCNKFSECYPAILKVCAKCYNDLVKEIIIKEIRPIVMACCSICLRFPPRIRDFHLVEVNARLCKTCYRRFAMNEEYIRKKGETNICPTYLELVKICRDDHIPLSMVGIK